jgi:hypothetical protein
MIAHKSAVALVALAAISAAAVAIARSPAEINISSFQKPQALAAGCPKIEWPYGCEWRPASDPRHLAARKSKRRALSLGFLAEQIEQLSF